MKDKFILVCVALLLCSAVLTASDRFEIQQLGEGLWGGSSATVPLGGALAIAVNSVNPNPPYDSSIKLIKLTGNGQAPIEIQIDSGSGSPTIPSLSYSEGELIVSYALGSSRKMAVSTDMGATWTIYNTGRTFELHPITRKVNNVYTTFSLDLPYPQWDQEPFLADPQSDELLLPQHFTRSDLSMNGTQLAFLGTHVYDGVVRTNSDLYIRQAGGGSNNGFPTFHAPVITSGSVVSNTGPYPVDIVFQGGLIENAPELTMPAGLDLSTYQTIGPASYTSGDIVLVEVNGNSYTAWRGVKPLPTTRNFQVYETYPADPLGDPLFVNSISMSDTLWTPLPPGTINFTHIRVNAQLWIKGTFSGIQHWSSPDSIKILGDILLSGTPAGDSPEANSADRVSLISEKGVQIKYGYRHPADSQRYHVARPTDQPFEIYASIFALGGESGNPRAGLFDFEYQHPHPSAPAMNIGGSLWTNIDLHRRVFPQTAADPWLPQLDLPWYNPLWPERTPYLERGAVRVWGSVFQNRKGFMHRALYDNEHPSNGVWDPPNDFCGSSSNLTYLDQTLGIQMQTINYPGTTGAGIGYTSYRMQDPRVSFSDLSLLNWSLGLKMGGLVASGTAEYSESNNYLLKHLSRVHSKAYTINNGYELCAVNNKLIARYNGGITDFSTGFVSPENITAMALAPDNSRALIVRSDNSFANTIVERLDLLTGELTELSFPTLVPHGTMSSALITASGHEYIVFFDGAELLMLAEVQGDLISYHGGWDLNRLQGNSAQWMKSRVHIIEEGEHGFALYIAKKLNPDQEYSNYEISYVTTGMPVSNDYPVLPPAAQFAFNTYPNPFRDEMRLELNGKDLQNHRIEVYNLRGQLVRSFTGADPSSTGRIHYSLKAVDSAGSRLSSGVYMIKVYVNDKAIVSRRISLF